MTENDAELKSRLVLGHKRDGRRRYSVAAKRELVAACLKPGISVARMAYEHGINANLLRKWITKYQGQREGAIAISPQGPSAPAFVPVIQVDPMSAAASTPPMEPSPPRLEARLPNGVIIELSDASEGERATVLRLLWTLHVPV
jgi:transposase